MIETASAIQIYENYDRALVQWVHNTCYWPFRTEDRQKVICVFSSPERAFAQVWKRLRPDDDSEGYRQKKIPLPFFSVNRIPGWAYDSTRDNIYTLKKYDAEGERYETASWPIPVILTYNISLWSRNLRDEDGLAMQLYRSMGVGPLIVLPVDHPEPIGVKSSTVQMAGDIRMEPIVGAEDQRIMRREFTVSMTGWITREDGPTPTLPIETVHSHIEDAETEEDFGTVIVPEDCE
jgi:hypothetical protein